MHCSRGNFDFGPHPYGDIQLNALTEAEWSRARTDGFGLLRLRSGDHAIPVPLELDQLAEMHSVFFRPIEAVVSAELTLRIESYLLLTRHADGREFDSWHQTEAAARGQADFDVRGLPLAWALHH